MTRAWLLMGSLLLAACGGETSAPEEASGGNAGSAGGAGGTGENGGGSSNAGRAGGMDATAGTAGEGSSGAAGSAAGHAAAGGTPSLAGGSGSGGLTGYAGASAAGARCVNSYSPPVLREPIALTADPLEATECSPPPESDECGCEERLCNAGATCVRVTQPTQSVVGGSEYEYNGCFELCSRDSDCTSPEICVENVHGLEVCLEVECRVDSECDEDLCGRCVAGYYEGHAGAVYQSPDRSYCAYAGVCGEGTCSGRACTLLDHGIEPYHRCYDAPE